MPEQTIEVEPNTEGVLVVKNFSGEALFAADAPSIKERALAVSVAVALAPLKDEKELKACTTVMRDLKDIIKTVEAKGLELRREPKRLQDQIKRLEDDFLNPLRAELLRIQGISNNFLQHQREEQRRHEQEAQRLALKAQQEAAAAQAKLDEAERLRQLALTAKPKEAAKLAEQVASLEDAALDQQLAAEEAAMQTQAIIPINKVAGLTVKERVNFQVLNWKAFLEKYPQFFQWDQDKELLKLCRRELLDVLNLEGKSNLFETSEEGLPLAPGLRIFRETKGFTR